MYDESKGEGSTIIGKSILIEGEIEGDEDLTVEGRVSGSIHLTKDLYIQPDGIVQANLDVRNVVIQGVLVGNVVASQRIELVEGGRMVGDIKAPRVLINDGAAFSGQVDMGEFTTVKKPEEEEEV